MIEKISFNDDYSYLAHPRILQAIEQASGESHQTYGLDEYSKKAASLFKDLTETDCDVHFISGGTQANLINISHILKPYESVITCDSGHIAVHETGAIEATGHKVHTTQNDLGKVTVQGINKIITSHHSEHMIIPKMVYLSQSTEKGTMYSLQELKDISAYCRTHDLYLYIDGARIACALAANECDFTLADIANLCDVLYFGGTKTGLLFGEATLLFNPDFYPNYRHTIKQRGGLLAKGAALGVQFHALMKDNLYLELAKHANDMAQTIAQSIANCGYTLDVPCQTNQVFVTLPRNTVESLEKDFLFLRWSEQGDIITIRLVTSWASKVENIKSFARKFQALHENQQ